MYGRHTLGNLRAFDTKRDETNAGRGEGQNRRELSTAGPTGPWDGLRNSILPENWFRQSFGGAVRPKRTSLRSSKPADLRLRRVDAT
jgi:hypothetical protein